MPGRTWKAYFKEGQEIVLATASRTGLPHAVVVVSLGFIGERLLVADCQMRTTIQNLLNRDRACAVSGYVRMEGRAKIFSSGKYLDACTRKSPGYAVRHAILISAEHVFDMDRNVRVK